MHTTGPIEDRGQYVGKPCNFNGLIYQSPAMHRVRTMLEQTLDSNISVLIHGETGTGKEVVARIIHENSKRGHRPFFCQNSGALPDSLLESELFGHKKGSFSGAIENKAGLFEEADGATVFLDEIGEASPALQVRLLRLLETGKFRRVGDMVERSCNVRIIAATNRDLTEAVREGRFREDLYYRLCVFPIFLPPLRRRKADIPALVDHFAREYCRENDKFYTPFPRETLEALSAQDWPGNVRELRNTIQRMLVTSSLTPPQNAQHIQPPNPKPRLMHTHPDGVIKTLEEVERDYIQHVLHLVDGNKTKAAQYLGLNRSTLRFRLKKLGLVHA